MDWTLYPSDLVCYLRSDDPFTVQMGPSETEFRIESDATWAIQAPLHSVLIKDRSVV